MPSHSFTSGRPRSSEAQPSPRALASARSARAATASTTCPTSTSACAWPRNPTATSTRSRSSPPAMPSRQQPRRVRPRGRLPCRRIRPRPRRLRLLRPRRETASGVPRWPSPHTWAPPPLPSPSPPPSRRPHWRPGRRAPRACRTPRFAPCRRAGTPRPFGWRPARRHPPGRPPIGSGFDGRRRSRGAWTAAGASSGRRPVTRPQAWRSRAARWARPGQAMRREARAAGSPWWPSPSRFRPA